MLAYRATAICGSGRVIKMTNYDRIKAMSVKEMAEFISSIYEDDEYTCPASKYIEGYEIGAYDVRSIADWLNSEVNE